jgi:hypothetical protein
MDEREDADLHQRVVQSNPAGCAQRQAAVSVSSITATHHVALSLTCLAGSAIASRIMATSGTMAPSRRQAQSQSYERYIADRSRLQTWGDPAQTHPETGGRGDGDALDVLEIGEQVGFVGQVKQVKPLGLVALMEDDRVDWKIIVVDIQDPNAAELNDISDIHRLFPGMMFATKEWLRYEGARFDDTWKTTC